MNAVSLYVTTCRMVFQSSVDDSSAWSDISRLLSYLRQALSCCVCGNLLLIPMTSTVSTCQHNVCKSCIGGKMRLKPSCSWCKDYNKFSENVHLRILSQCYKKLCKYLISSTLNRKWGNLNGGSNVNFADIVQEGADLRDEFRYSDIAQRNNRSASVTNTSRSVLPESTDGASGSECISSPNPSEIMNGDVCKGMTNGNGSVYSVTVADSTSTKIMIKRTISENSENQNLALQDTLAKRLRTGDSTRNSLKIKPKKKGCRCGLATPNPGKLTCCGQRCPCYVDGKACNECRCRGCRNPHKHNSIQNCDSQIYEADQEFNMSDVKSESICSKEDVKSEDDSDIDIDG